jgi:hypothetical protein
MLLSKVSLNNNNKRPYTHFFFVNLLSNLFCKLTIKFVEPINLMINFKIKIIRKYIPDE